MLANLVAPKDFLLCLGTSAECACLIIDSLQENFHVLALGLDEQDCIQELLGSPAFYQNAALRDRTLILQCSHAELLALSSDTQVQDLLAAKIQAALRASLQVAPAPSAFSVYQFVDITKEEHHKLLPNYQELQVKLGDFLSRDLQTQPLSAVEFNALSAKLNLVVFSHVNLIDDKSNEQLSRIFQVKGVLPSPIGFMIKHVGRLNDSLGSAGISEQCALNFTDKKRVYELLCEQGANVAEQWCLSEDEVLLPHEQRLALIKDFMAPLGWPLLLKPRFGSGSRHVYVVNSLSELDQALDNVAKLILKKRSPEGRDIFVYDMLVERYIHHEIELTVNGMIKDGKIIVALCLDKILMSALPYRQEMAYSSTLLPEFMRKAVIAELEQVAKALHIDNSAIMSDMIIELPAPLEPYSNSFKVAPGEVVPSKDYDPCNLEDSYSKRHDYSCYQDRLKVYAVDTAGRHTGYYLHASFSAAHCSLIPYFLKYVIAKQQYHYSPQELDELVSDGMSKVAYNLSEHHYVQHFYNLKIGTIAQVPDVNTLLELIAKALGHSMEQALKHIAFFKCTLEPGMVIDKQVISNGAITSLGFIILKDVPEDKAIKIVSDFCSSIVYQA